MDMRAVKLASVKSWGTQISSRETYPNWRKWFSTFVWDMLSAVAIFRTDWGGFSSMMTLTSVESISVGRPERGASLMSKSPERNLANHFWHTRSVKASFPYTRHIFYESSQLVCLFWSNKVKYDDNGHYLIPFLMQHTQYWC